MMTRGIGKKMKGAYAAIPIRSAPERVRLPTPTSMTNRTAIVPNGPRISASP